MGLDDWNGYEQFLQSEESITEWIHMTMQDTPKYLQEHVEAVSEVDRLNRLYLDSYGSPLSEDLLEADTKYDTKL